MSTVILPKNVVSIRKDEAIMSYDSSIYSVTTVNAVSHYMIGKCETYVSKEEHKIIVQIISNDNQIDKYISEFNEELINYTFYEESMEKKYELRKMILERVLNSVKTKSGEIFVES